MQDDAELVVRCLEGNTDAYTALVHRYQGAVYATAFYYAGRNGPRQGDRHGAAEDIVQEAFLTAYRSLPWLKQGDKFGPWLKSITCRTAANWMRRHQKQLMRETPYPAASTISIEDAREGPHGAAERAERYERVQRAINALPERYRLPVVLRYLQELSYEEISSFTGGTREEIRGVLQRAGSQLRDLLSDLEKPASGEAGAAS